MVIRNKPSAFVRSKIVEDTEGRFKRLMPKGNDLTLIVLKGHLLLEEIVTGLIEDHCAHPKALADARLEFYQKLILAKAFIPLGEDDELWVGVKKLNSIRNQLAHNIEPKGLLDKIDDFIKDLIENFRHPKDPKTRAKMLKLAVAWLCGHMAGFREGYKVARKVGRSTMSVGQKILMC